MHRMTIKATNGGTTIPAPGTYNTRKRSWIIIAYPDKNGYFQHWEVDGLNIGSANPLLIPVNRKNHVVKAHLR